MRCRCASAAPWRRCSRDRTAPYRSRRSASALQDDARVADALIAVQQIDLFCGDFPNAVVLPETVTLPAGQDANLTIPEFADGEVRPHHALVGAGAPEDLDVRDHARGSRRRRL